MNAFSFPLPAGYLTGQFVAAKRLLDTAPSPEQLLDLLLLADQLDAAADSHPTPPPGEWGDLREKAGAALMRFLTGSDASAGHFDWRNAEADWQPRMFRHALKSLPGMSDGELLTLFIQSAETAYLNESKPMQARWETVSAESRAEILRRVQAPKMVADHPVASEDDERGSAVDDTAPATQAWDEDGEAVDFDFVSIREALRVAEDAFRPDISNEELLDLYLLVTDCGSPDHAKVFDEIKQAVKDEVVRRMKAGDPNPELCEYVPAFDYPDQNKKSLKALLRGNLPHRNLLLLFEYTWDAGAGDIELAIADLSRGQILRRMSPPTPEDTAWDAWQDRSRSALVRRVLAHDRPTNISRRGERG